MAARDAIQKLVLLHRRRYGYRRVTAELHRQGNRINHKRVLRIMGEDNLLAIVEGRLPPHLVNPDVRWRVLQEAYVKLQSLSE